MWLAWEALNAKTQQVIKQNLPRYCHNCKFYKRVVGVTVFVE